jgi:cupin fold WbuC family metalloprotein
MEPDSYIQPHRHLDTNKDETLIAIRGKMGLITFDSSGNIEETVFLEPNGQTVLVNIAHGTYHTLISLEEGSIFFEAKGGPYLPLTPDEKASWAPEEGNPSAPEYLHYLKKIFSDCAGDFRNASPEIE